MIILWVNSLNNMALTYKGLIDIAYPAFRLPTTEWESRDGLVFVNNQIVDDRNMPGETLGLRRLQTPMKGLLPLNKAYEFPIAIIKETPGLYIDNKGYLFVYQKTKFVELKYYKIKKIDRKVVASILWLQGINFPIRVPRPPPEKYLWGGMLHLYHKPWLLYNYAEQKLPDSRRKI
jgi:hypothetical protein